MDNTEPTPEAFAESATEQIKIYADLRIRLLKAQLTGKLSLIAGKILSGVIILFLLFFALLFVSLVAGFYLSTLLGGLMQGFGVVAVFYVVLVCIVSIFRKRLIELPAADKVVEIIYETDEA
jgi:uncharacterized membrane protein YagU involved in acid resistance